MVRQHSNDKLLSLLAALLVLLFCEATAVDTLSALRNITSDFALSSYDVASNSCASSSSLKSLREHGEPFVPLILLAEPHSGSTWVRCKASQPSVYTP